MSGNILLDPLTTLQDQIAALSDFQTFVGEANATDAETHIYLISAPLAPAGNFCIVDFGTYGREREAIQNGAAWQPRGGSSLMLYVRQVLTDDPEEPAAATAFTNFIGDILEELEASAALPGKMHIANWFLNQPPIRIASENRTVAGDYYECEIELSFTRQP